jgi:hypothetical protein
MLRFAHLRKTLGLALLACTLTPPVLLASQAVGPHPALASINVVPPPIPVDGTWSDGRERISPVIVTRQQARQNGRILTRFIVQAFHGTRSIGTGATPWRLLGRYDLGSVSVTITGPCTSAPICPNLYTNLTLTTTTLTTPTNPVTKFATLQVRDHTLAGEVSWSEWLAQS